MRRVRLRGDGGASQSASANNLPGMFKAVLKAEKGTECEAAEAVVVAAGGIDDADARQRDVVGLGKVQRPRINLRCRPLGRVGGAKSTPSSNERWPTKTCLAAMPVYGLCATGPTPRCWTNYLLLAEKADSPAHRAMIFQAFVRIGRHGRRSNRSGAARADAASNGSRENR